MKDCWYVVDVDVVKLAAKDGRMIKENKKISMTILVAEDEELNLLYIKELFSSKNYELISASNGKEALALFKENLDVDLVLMDIKMPEMDGYAAAGYIREINHNVPILALTAYALESEVKRFGDVFDAYLTKPIQAPALMDTVERFLKKD